MAIIYTEDGERKAKVGETAECPACGKSFTVTNVRQVYCPDCRKSGARKQEQVNRAIERSIRMYGTGKKKEEREYVCKNCGKKFKAWSSSTYCSPECRDQYHIDHTFCAECGKPMTEMDDAYIDPEAYMHPWFCSPECKKKHEIKLAKKGGYYIICPVCGKGFVSHGRGEKLQKFCSRKCFLVWQETKKGKKKEPKRCKECGRPLDGSEWRNSGFDIRGFCSIRCRRAHYARTRTGRWETCQVCGKKFWWSADETAFDFYCSEECAEKGRRYKKAGLL